MPPDETVSGGEKSVLDKPLHLLTEDDISQLTREDCRRYLKQKGMRRPSWNKSQAIQQVISLKSLLEPTPEADSAAPRKKLYSPYNLNAPRTAPRGKDPDPEPSEETELEPYESHDREKPAVSGNPTAAASDSTPRNRGSGSMPVGQMTVFYCGKVNVYDAIPADKAQVIMHLAASQLPLPPDVSLDNIIAMQPGCQLQDINTKVISGSTALPISQTVIMSEKTRLLGEGCRSPDENAVSEDRGSRKASVQRFLEKRKDRHKRMMNVKY